MSEHNEFGVVLRSAIDDIAIINESFKDLGVLKDGPVDLSEFTSNFVAACSIIKFKTGTLAMMSVDTSSQPPDQILLETLTALKEASCALLSACSLLTTQAGQCYSFSWRQLALSIISSLLHYLTNLEARHTISTTSASTLWHHIDSIQRQPVDNKLAVLQSISKVTALVEDALEELVAEDFLSSPSVDVSLGPSSEGDSSVRSLEEDFGMVCLDKTLSDRELKELVNICVGLIKSARACCKKAHSAVQCVVKCGEPEVSQSLDQTFEVVKGVSERVDEFVLCLYPPRRPESLMQEAQKLSDHLGQIIAVLSSGSLLLEDDKQIAMLKNAVDHNFNKLSTYIESRKH